MNVKDTETFGSGQEQFFTQCRGDSVHEVYHYGHLRIQSGGRVLECHHPSSFYHSQDYG